MKSYSQLFYTQKRNFFSSVIPIEKTNKAKLEPYFITGFSDAEGCFLVGLNKDLKRKWGDSISLEFTIALHEKELAWYSN